MKMNWLRTQFLVLAVLFLLSVVPMTAQRRNGFDNGMRRGGQGGNYYDSQHDYRNRNDYRNHDDRNKGGIGPGKGALIGGAGGAALGAIFGGGLKGTLIGGAAGAGIGAVVGEVNQNNRDNDHRRHRR
jgi:hypothetical protein